MTGRRFKVWEGGARFNVRDSWTDAHLLRGHRLYAAKRYKEALADCERALAFPEGLQTARHRTGGCFPEVAYWVGLAQQTLGRNEDAQRTWKESAGTQVGSRSDDILASADSTVLRFYQALALSKLGEQEKAAAVCKRLLTAGAASRKRTQETDIFAKFGEGQTPA